MEYNWTIYEHRDGERIELYHKYCYAIFDVAARGTSIKTENE